MTPFTLTLELALNSRTLDGLSRVEQHHAHDYGYAIIADRYVLVTLNDLDFGRYDSEGDAYIAELLGIVEGDILHSYIEEVF